MSLAERDSSTSSKTVERALRLLRVVAVSSDGITLSAAARAVDLPTSTVARLLRTLETQGFILRGEDGTYAGGSSIFQIGAIALANLGVYALVEPHLRRLSDYTGETSYLAAPEGQDSAIYLKQVESPRAIRHASWTGRAISTAGTALGAALEGRVTADGYASSRGTPIEPDAAAAAAPIHDSIGDIVAAVSIIGPSFRISDDELIDYGLQVAEHAQLISDQLRNLPPQGKIRLSRSSA
jgi:IclR family acetate operon transcriptional repressor